LRLQAEKAEERKATEQQADSLEIAASEALTKAKAGMATGKTDAVVARVTDPLIGLRHCRQSCWTKRLI